MLGLGTGFDVAGRRLLLAAAGIALTSGAAAQDGSAPAPAQAEPDIVVTADPSQRSSIDRETYLVRDTPEARAANVLDVLARVPSIEVTPNGQVRLLGTPGVKILIDGREVADPMALLRSWPGSQVARIEVITNPSAQFSAQGTAGIINIVTRRTFLSGLAGSVSGNADSQGSYELKASPTWTRGPVTLSGTLGGRHNAGRSSYARDRTGTDPSGGMVASEEEGESRSGFDTPSLILNGSYRLTPRQSLGLQATFADFRGGSTSSSLLEAEGSRVALSARDSFSGANNEIAADYRREGAQPGDSLTASAKWGDYGFLTAGVTGIDDGAGPPGLFRQVTEQSGRSINLQFDYARTLAGGHRLSLGAAYEDSTSRQRSHSSGELALGGGAFALDSALRGGWRAPAAYVTYQIPLLGGTALAGLRVEGRSSRIDGAREPPAGGTHLFPSLHLERGVRRGLTADLSYSRRIFWPNLEEQDPTLRYSDPTSGSIGNPLLRPELTDAYEAKLKAELSGHNLDLTFYTRRTGDLLSSRAEFNGDGVLVSTRVNFGTRTARGASLSARGPLLRGLRYTLTGNLADLSFGRADIGPGLAPGNTQYGGTLQLEYRDGRDGRRGADRVTLTGRFSGPTDIGFLRISSYASANFSWSHAISDRWTGVLTISNPFGAPNSRVTYLSDTSRSVQTNQSPAPVVRLSLTYSLGAPSGN